jgi:HSP20 family protein
MAKIPWDAVSPLRGNVIVSCVTERTCSIRLGGVSRDGRLVLHGDLRGMLKEVKELLLAEWSVGPYHRELVLTTPVNAECTNVTYGNGVLLITLPISEQTLPARLTLERITPTHGERKGNAGHPPLCVHT